MLEVVLTIPFWLEFSASLTGGLSGAMSATRARYDIFGVVCIAIITGLAGGIVRDVLMQNYGIYAFQKPTLIVACAVAGVGVFYFGKLATFLDPVISLLDNISVGLWSVISVGKALSAGLDIIPAIILGTISAVGGGILRDICMNREPEAFQAGALYGSAALVGATIYALLHQNHILTHYAELICVAIVVILRYSSLLFGWRTKEPHDYSDVVTSAVARPVLSVARRVRPPKGKVERERERKSAYEHLRRLWRAPGCTSPLPPLHRTGTAKVVEPLSPSFIQASSSEKLTEPPQADPSDRIIVDRSEFRRIIEQTSAKDDAPSLHGLSDPFDDTPDPFEPRN